RFTIAKECGLPANVKQIYLQANEADIEVNLSSPTGYPMRMLKSSPSLSSNTKPNCEALGYLLDRNGQCAYHQAWNSAGVDEKGRKLPIREKMCICYHFMKYNTYTCGQNVYRLKDTTTVLPNGQFYIPSAEHIFNDYRYSTEHEILLPSPKQLAPEETSRNGTGGKEGSGSLSSSGTAKDDPTLVTLS
ncbi:MAG: hypothetical protein KDD69_20370, partial [Bdellovibrionales bacterium]|nr:hypothetical protein [Bdellovibrionales bacterium]